MTALSEEEMADIDRAIMIALGLHNVSDDEDESANDESDNDEIEALREELASLKHSGLAWKKLYEKALDEIASLRFEADLGKRIAVAPKVEEPAIAEPKVEEPVEEESPLVDLNTCSESDLRNCGCDPQLIRNIIARRPYKTVYDLRFVPGLKSVGYAILKAKVCVGEPKQEERTPKVKPAKVNINTATAKELMEGVGLSTFYAYRITAWRNQHGSYKSLESLLEAKKIPKDFLERYGDKLTV
jgi:competence ComEA-like helix-hairpin-helix protein